MGLFDGLVKIAIAPVAAVTEVVKDISGQNGEEGQALGILTLGIGSAVKGAAKAVGAGVADIVDGVDDVVEYSGTRKIAELPVVCRNPNHNPPTHVVYPDGIYEHTCPGCGKKERFTVNNSTF